MKIQESEIGHRIKFSPNEHGLKELMTLDIAASELGISVDDLIELSGKVDPVLINVLNATIYVERSGLKKLKQRLIKAGGS